MVFFSLSFLHGKLDQMASLACPEAGKVCGERLQRDIQGRN